jgi:hypothetical protein
MGGISGKAPKVRENKADKLNNGRETPQVAGGAVNRRPDAPSFFCPKQYRWFFKLRIAVVSIELVLAKLKS